MWWMLSACTPATPIASSCPPAIWMPSAAIDGYEACPTNPAFDSWMDKIQRQQGLLDKSR